MTYFGVNYFLSGLHSYAAGEAVQCPTMIYNGFGEHNIQGIGDKHVPLIHNAMNTDFIVDISDKATDNLLVLFNSEVGHEHLRERMGVPQAIVDQLCSFGFSSICNVLAAIKDAIRDTGELADTATSCRTRLAPAVRRFLRHSGSGRCRPRSGHQPRSSCWWARWPRTGG